MPVRGCAEDWGRKIDILRVRKNTGPILSRLRTKAHQIMELCRGPLDQLTIVLYDTFARLFPTATCQTSEYIYLKSKYHTHSARNLGFIFDENLTFSDQISIIL